MRKDEVLALRSSFRGLSKKVRKSTIDEGIKHISNVTGQIVVRGLPIPVETKAYIPGRVLS